MSRKFWQSHEFSHNFYFFILYLFDIQFSIFFFISNLFDKLIKCQPFLKVVCKSLICFRSMFVCNTNSFTVKDVQLTYSPKNHIRLKDPYIYIRSKNFHRKIKQHCSSSFNFQAMGNLPWKHQQDLLKKKHIMTKYKKLIQFSHAKYAQSTCFQTRNSTTMTTMCTLFL